MPHQFLHNLELGPSSAEQGRVCPAECVPPDPLRDAQLLRDDGADVMTKKLLSPIRVLSSILRAGEDPTLRCSIRCSAAPVPQITDQMIVERKRVSNPPSQGAEPVLKCGYGSSDERSPDKTTDTGRDSADCGGVCN